MKKYKLLKWYPGCGKQKVGTIITSSKCSSPLYLGERLTDTLNIVFSAKNVENNPEYWEEIVDKNPLKLEVGKTYELQYIHCKSKPFKAIITRITSGGYPWMEKLDNSGNGIVTDSYKLIREIVDRDYEILAFKRDGGNYDGITFTLKTDGKYEASFTKAHLSLKHCLNGRFKIHSVKRLSDGEVFTVGDNVKISAKSNPCSEQTTIQDLKFWLKEINKLSHIKKPLFKTEDGVDIFEGDKYYFVELDAEDDSFKCFKRLCTSRDTRLIEKHKDIKGFSTKEKAEEYIMMNKPCLSMQDLKNTGCISQIQWDIILNYIRTTKL
jgi:hypothetical protein